MASKFTSFFIGFPPRNYAFTKSSDPFSTTRGARNPSSPGQPREGYAAFGGQRKIRVRISPAKN